MSLVYWFFQIQPLAFAEPVFQTATFTPTSSFVPPTATPTFTPTPTATASATPTATPTPSPTPIVHRIQRGDTLLLMGADEAIEAIRSNDDIVLLDRPPVPAGDVSNKKPLVLAVLCAIVCAVTLKILPIVGAVKNAA